MSYSFNKLHNISKLNWEIESNKLFILIKNTVKYLKNVNFIVVIKVTHDCLAFNLWNNLLQSNSVEMVSWFLFIIK